MRTADTWWALRNTHANITVSRQTGVNNRYCIRTQRNNGTTDTDAINLCVSMETQDAAWMATALPTLTLSFYARSGANYSAASGNLVVTAIRGTGTDQNQLDGYTSSSTLATLTQALTTSFVRYSLTVTPDGSTNELAINFAFTPVGTAGAADYFDIECLQLEVSAAAGAFERRSFGREIVDCKRYYQKSFPYTATPAQGWGTTEVYYMMTVSAGAVAIRSSIPFSLSPQMRATGNTVTTFNPVSANAEARDIGGATDATGTGAALVSQNAFSIAFTPNAATGAAARMSFHWTCADPNF